MFKNKRQVIFNFIVTLGLFALFMTLYYHYNKYTELDSVKSALEQKISEELDLVENRINQTSGSFRDELEHLADKKPFRDFVYFRNDSLRFYTTNEIVWTDSCLRKDNLCVERVENRVLVINPIAVSENEKVLHLITIRKKYEITNQFLKNDFLVDQNISSAVAVTEESTGETVYVRDRDLFSIQAQDELSISNHQANVLFIVFLVFLLSGFIFINVLYKQLNFFTTRPVVRLFGSTLDILIFLFIIVYFQIPGVLFGSYLFDGSLFVFPGVFQSLGQALFLLVGASVITWNIFQTGFDYEIRKKIPRLIHGFLLITLSVLVLFFPYMLIKNLVLNSSIPLSITAIDEVDFTSFIALLAIFNGGLAAVLLNLKLLRLSYHILPGKAHFLIINSVAGLVIFALALIQNPLYFYILLQYVIFVFVVYYFRAKINLTAVLLFLIASAIAYSVILEQMNDQKEKKQIEVRAISLLNNRDKISEFRFYEESNKLGSDTVVDSLVKKYRVNALVEDQLIEYIDKNYFRSFHIKYKLNFTLCDSTTKLIIDDERNPVDCYAYFSDIIDELGVSTVSEDLYYIDDGDEIRNYVGKLRLAKGLRLYMDIYQKSSPLAQGYPELLESRYSEKMLDPEYSYASYYRNELVNSYGEVNYPINYQKGIEISEKEYEHYEFYGESGKVLVISKRRDTFTEYLAGATDFILIFGVLLLVFYFMNQQKVNLADLDKFRSRLQLSIFSILLFSFIIIGFFVFTHISEQNEEKNRNNLEELSHSIRIELEHKFAHLEEIDNISQNYIYEQLVKFSQVFFSDINLFNTQGELITSSRPRVFERNIISKRINPDPFYKLKEKDLSIFIHKETIGDYRFLSSYFPLRNYDNEVIAYINLPYFLKQRQLTEEISAFLTTFINIYIILTIASLFIIWVISNYITKPMETIKTFLRKTKLQEKNAKINIDRKDEIGELVKEYNSMVDELDKSARLLAASERETAWREMARQVAHEIKNPLTPMKLSVQQFERSFLKNPEKSEEAVKRFTWNMIDQIDSLSEIASAFSDFAKMPKASLQKLNIADSIRNTVELFEGDENVEITTQFGDDNIFIEADQKQIQRVFINLIKNSVQAMRNQSNPKVRVEGYKEKEQAVIVVRDNGPGIPTEVRDKIFLPNFTTKSGGTGLGLAMVKNIVTGFGGEISLVQSDEQGTVFKLTFPLWQNSEL